jgi:hypothetical protein
VYIDKDNKLHVGPGEIPAAGSITFGDERYMAEPDNPIAEVTAEAFRDLQERIAELDERELSVAASELRMKELLTTCIEILFTTLTN